MRSYLDALRRRIASGWKTAQFMAVALFAMLIVMIVATVVTGIVLRESTYPIVFGGLSLTSLLSVLIWKPLDRVQQATVASQRLELLLLILEQEWEHCSELTDPARRLEAVREVNQMVLGQMRDISETPTLRV